MTTFISDNVVDNNITSLAQLENTHGWKSLETFEVPYSAMMLFNCAGITDFQHVPNTDFFLGAGKDTITIIVGESWTYGETIRVDKHGQRVEDNIEATESFEQAISNTIGAKIAKILDSDLHQSAWPGNSNAYYFKRLDSLIEEYKDRYDKVYIVVCITEHFREESCAPTGIFPDMVSHKFWHTDDHGHKTPEHFLSDYESIYLDHLEHIALNNSNFQIICWKNFTKWYSDISDRKIISIAEHTITDMFRGTTPTVIAPPCLEKGIFYNLCNQSQLENYAAEIEKTNESNHCHSSHYPNAEEIDLYAKYLTDII